MSIVTLTMNPAIDKGTSVDKVVPEDKLRCDRPTYEPGGGGINVTRAIRKLGGESTALYLCGGFTGQMLQNLLTDEGIDHQPIPINGFTRENLIVLETSSEKQYRFGMPGPEVREAEWQSVLEALKNLVPAPEYLVLSGSLPAGVPSDFYARVARLFNPQETRIILDTSGKSMSGGIQESVYLVKPNLRELEQLAGRALEDEDAQIDTLRGLMNDHKIEVGVLSLGAGGALLVQRSGSQFFRSPTVPIISKVGAGDSMVAGLTLGLSHGLSIEDSVRYGVSAGAAAVMTPGTELCRKEDTERLYVKLKLQETVRV